jgi:hypothetical protein
VRPARQCRPFSFQPESFSSTRPQHAWGPSVSGCRKSQQRRNSVRLYPNSQRHLRAVAILVEARRRGPMRAYVTAAGMAFGLVAVWAALVPFVV